MPSQIWYDFNKKSRIYIVLLLRQNIFEKCKMLKETIIFSYSYIFKAYTLSDEYI